MSSGQFRWFRRQTRRIEADLTLELVSELDTVLNNTSLILLLEAGDAQIENWAFALRNPEWRRLLADVNVYKVGHHGSRNATPRSLWALFRHRGDEQQPERLATLCSTRSGKHGRFKSGTEVPRRALVEELRDKSAFACTEEFKSGTRENVRDRNRQLKASLPDSQSLPYKMSITNSYKATYYKHGIALRAFLEAGCQPGIGSGAGRRHHSVAVVSAGNSFLNQRIPILEAATVWRSKGVPHGESYLTAAPEVADWFELGHALGRNHAFAVMAGRCSAAQAAGLHRMREEKSTSVAE